MGRSPAGYLNVGICIDLYSRENLGMTLAEARNSPERSDIPAHLVFDVDIFNLPGAEDDVQLAWRRLQTDLPPIFWTPKNGGHWICTRSEDIKYIHQTHNPRFPHKDLLPNRPL